MVTLNFPLRTVEVVQTISKFRYPTCIGQSAATWVISPFCFSLLLSLGKHKGGNKYFKFYNDLKANNKVKLKVCLFSPADCKQADKFNQLPLKDMSRVNTDFSKPDASGIIKKWVKDQGIKLDIDVNLSSDIIYSLVSVSSFQIIELPLEDVNCRLLVLTPSKVDPLGILFRRLSYEGVANTFENLRPLFTIDSTFVPPIVNFSISQVEIDLTKEERKEFQYERIIQTGTASISNTGISVDVVTCVYATKSVVVPKKVKFVLEKAPFFVAVIYKDTPIFTGQYVI